jgi:hypothetical protein
MRGSLARGDPARFVRKSRLWRTSGLFDSAAKLKRPSERSRRRLKRFAKFRSKGVRRLLRRARGGVPCITVSSTMITKRRSNTEVADRLNEFHFEGANKPGGELINLAHWMFGCIPLHC